MPIDPISLPNAAAENYGEGDVRHFSEGDALDVPGLSNPTRQLAERDVRLASKVNEIIADVNNKETPVPILIQRTTLPPNSEEVVFNFRIPPGFESRILSAIVTGIPASISAELDIYYSTGYGNSTGTQIISTSTEFSSGTEFFSNGEFIVTLKNRGGTTLAMMASVQATMRPLTARDGLLLPSAVVGQQGPPGPTGLTGGVGKTGPVGPAGSPGLTWQSTWNNASTYSSTDVVFWSGSAYKSKANSNTGNQPDLSPSWWEYLAQQGSPGINWQGDWNSATAYAVNDGVAYLGSSYRCLVANTNKPPATNASYWEIVAQGGTGFRFRGAWANPPVDGLGAYLQNDVVNIITSGSITQTYIAVGNPPNASTAPPNSDWNQLFSAGSPAFSVSSVTSNIYAEASYVAVDTSGQYETLGIAAYPGTTTYTLQEAISQDAASGHGVGFLKTYMYVRWIGDVTLTLPSTSNGAQLNWTGSDVVLSIQSAGSLTFSGTVPTQFGGPAQVPGTSSAGTVPSFFSGPAEVPGVSSAGTIDTRFSGPVEIPGYATTGTTSTSYTGPVEIPGYSISISGNFISTFQNGTNITIHNPTSDAADVTIGIIGFQVF